MKPAVLNSIERSGNLAGESVTMTVDVTAMEHIMTLLTDLYSDRELAVIREYSTNALDSHVEAGNPNPIEIFTPGPLNPFFKIKDYGIGLDAEGIRNIYSKYGASTKRDTDKQVGMLGLGCKSALTYAPQFTLVGTKDGIKTVVAISRDEKGRGNMEILETLVTDEPNGVEIMIPVTGRNSFIEKATKFFSFWKPGTVLVNGQQPNSPKLTIIKDNVYIADADFGDYVVMGNVAYPVKEGAINTNSGWQRKYSVVAFVEIGDVHFTPSREALHYTPHTDAQLTKIRQTVSAHLSDAIQREIEQAENAAGALESYMKWQQVLNINYRYGQTRVKYFWRGIEVTDEYHDLKNLWTYNIGQRGGDTQTNSIRYAAIKSSNIRIVGFTEDEFLPKHKSKIRSWVNATHYGQFRVLVCDQLPGAPFTSEMETVNWKDILSFKPPRVARGESKQAKHWPTITQSGYVNDNGTIDASQPIYYIERKRRTNVAYGIKSVTGLDAQFVAVPTNRLNSFKKQFPQAIELEVWLKKKAKDALDKLTASDYAKMKLDQQDVQILKVLDVSKIEDPEILVYINVAKGVQYTPAVAELNKYNGYLENFGFGRISIPNSDATSIFNVRDYPLIASQSWWSLKEIKNGHIELYINSVYNSKEN